jgi:hypothetical protein
LFGVSFLVLSTVEVMLVLIGWGMCRTVAVVVLCSAGLQCATFLSCGD